MRINFNNGKMIVTHPTGIVCEYDEAALRELLKKAKRDCNEANEDLERANYQIELLKGSKKNV